MSAPTLTTQELVMLGNARMIAAAKEMVRQADEAQRRVDQKQPQKLLTASHG